MGAELSIIHTSMNLIEETLLNAVTATTTSKVVNVEGCTRIGLQFKRADHSAGSSAFSAEGTINGKDWTTLNLIISNATNTNAQTLTRVASVSLAANGTALAFLDAVCLKAIRVTVTETTDGTHSAWMIAA